MVFMPVTTVIPVQASPLHKASKGTPSGLRPASPKGNRQRRRAFNMLKAKMSFNIDGVRGPVAPPLEELPKGLRRSLGWPNSSFSNHRFKRRNP